MAEKYWIINQFDLDIGVNHFIIQLLYEFYCFTENYIKYWTNLYQ